MVKESSNAFIQMPEFFHNEQKAAIHQRQLTAGCGPPSANFITRESLWGQVQTGRFRASNSESWRARLEP